MLNQAPILDQAKNDVDAIESIEVNNGVQEEGQEQVDVDAVGPDNADAELEMSDLLRLPYELQIAILQKLIPDPKFMSYFLSYAATARLPRKLIMDFSIWMEVAHHWFKPENLSRLSKNTVAKTLQMITLAGRDHLLDFLDPKFEHLYHTNGMALVAATKSLDLHSVEVFLKRLATNKYPHYIGEALKAVAESDVPVLAKRLLTELMGKNPQGRNSQIHETFRTALSHESWRVISTLAEQLCTLDSGLLGEALVASGKQNKPETVKALIQHRLNELAFMAKWTVKSTPGFQSSGLTVDDLFANHYWPLRAPLTAGLHQIGYASSSTASCSVEQEDVDTDAITALLDNLSLEQSEELLPGSSDEPEQERKLKP